MKPPPSTQGELSRLSYASATNTPANSRTERYNDSPPETICGVFVTYHQEAEEFEDAIERALAELDGVVVVDNNTEARWVQEVALTVKRHSSAPTLGQVAKPVTLTQVGKNLGLAAAYNIAVDRARESGFQAVLLLDQDSVLLPGVRRELLTAFRTLSSRYRIGAMSCLNKERVESSSNEWIKAVDRVRTGLFGRRSPALKSEPLVEIPTFTNSGTMIPASALDRAGQFNENLFVDAVDYDYSLRLREYGLRIFLSRRAGVSHRMGHQVSRSLAGSEVSLRSYPPSRTYHIVKDTLTFGRYWMRRYPREVVGILITTMLSTAGAILLLPDHTRRCENVLSALRDFGHRSRGAL